MELFKLMENVGYVEIVENIGIVEFVGFVSILPKPTVRPRNYRPYRKSPTQIYSYIEKNTEGLFIVYSVI